MKKRKLKITPIIVTLNVAFLILIAGYYLYRGVHYYLEENGKKETTGGTILLVDYLSNKQSLLDDTKGLVYDEVKNVYTYKGKVEDNYLYYSGILFRIVGIDNENNIKAVSDKNLTIMYSGLEKGFEESYVAKWLNTLEGVKNSGNFINLLYNNEQLLANTYNCLDIIDDPENITCEENNNDYKVTLLSLYDFNEAGGQNSYLNNGETFYLNTLNSENENYVINSDGSTSLNNISTRALGVRPVITINSESVLLSGDGTIEKPYIIEEHEIKTLNDVYVGQIFEFSLNKFKVIEKDEDKILVSSIEALTEDDELINKSFGSNNKYSTSKKTLGNYLNNDYYDSLENKDYIVKSKWYIGENTLDDLNYINKYDSSVSANIGLLSLGNMFIHEVKNVFTLSRGIENNSIIDVINENGNLYGDLVTTKYNVRPAFYLKSNLTITEGEGTEESPYKLGDVNEEETKEE